MGPSTGSRFVTAALILLLLACGSAMGQERDPPVAEATIDRWTGCYDVHRDEWEPPMPEQADSLYYRPPPRVELTDDSAGSGYPGPPGEEWRRMEPAPGSLPSVHSITVWRPLTSDSLEVLWSSTGTSGVSGSLSGRRGTLEGRFQTFTDVSHVPRRRASARLVRVSCSAPPEVPASSQRPVFRSVPLATGDTVTLGRPVRDELDRIQRWSEETPGALGVFSGAGLDRVEDIRGDTAREIGVYYPPGVDFDSLVSAWTDSLGPPVRWGMAAPGERRSNAYWHNRTTVLSVTLLEGLRDGAIAVMMYDPRY